MEFVNGKDDNPYMKWKIKNVWNNQPVGYAQYIDTFISGWWLTYPSDKYDFVSWDDEIPNIYIYIYVYIYKYIYGKINFMFQTTNQPNKVDTINIWNHQPANKRQSCWWFLIFNQQRTTHQSSVNMRATRRLVHNVMALWDLFSSTPAIVTSLPRQFVILLDISGCYNVASRAVWKLLERGCYNVASRADWKLLERGCDNVASRASWKFLEKDVTM